LSSDAIKVPNSIILQIFQLDFTKPISISRSASARDLILLRLGGPNNQEGIKTSCSFLARGGHFCVDIEDPMAKSQVTLLFHS
jgi:hypothetical protein